MGIEILGMQLAQLLLFAASTAYQITQSNKMKREADKRKGFSVTVAGQATAVPVVYGKNVLGGFEVKHLVHNSYTSATDNASKTFTEDFSNTSRSGSKSEYLTVQYALCHEGIEGVQWVKVNQLDYNSNQEKFKHIVRTHKDGGSADAIATANGIPSTNTFTNTASASATFQLDRDDYNYNGIPQMEFLVKGRKVKWVEESGGVYSLSTDRIYSNNPALCLLDYLMDTTYGRGLSTSEVDLESFYNSADVCDTIVATNRTVAGQVNGQKTVHTVADNGSRPTDLEKHTYENELWLTQDSGKYWYWNKTVWVETTLNSKRPIPLYECNITLDTGDKIRDNIERIMNTMGLAELTWSSEGKYKLLLEHPTTTAQQNALVDASHYFTEDDIIRDSVEISWPNASSRLNQVTIGFLNEHEDFKEDTITWPTSFSTAHNQYLTEDNNQPFQADIDADGITDPYHAQAMAEQAVRMSRSMFILNLTVSKKGLSLEPGDFININSDTLNINSEVFRVESIEVKGDFTVGLTCYRFDFETLAWNINDNIAYRTTPTYDFSVEPVTSLTYTAGRPEADTTALAELTWTAPTDGSFKAIVFYTADNGSLTRLGETSSDNFLIYPRSDWANGESVTFTVKAQTPLGRKSVGVSVTHAVVKVPATPTSFSVVETLYQTNKASGVKARATISFSEPAGGVKPKDYKIRFYRDEDGSTYNLLGFTVGEEYIIDDVRAGNYHFEITSISHYGHESTALIGTKEILGLSAIPDSPTGFTSKVTDAGMLLSWDEPTDLDVLSGGFSRIKYIRNDYVTPKWEIAQTVAERISGSTTTATLPAVPGYYMIKHFDSSGNQCAEPALLLNSFVGPDFNVITTVTEAPTFAGTKTNCTVVGSELSLDAGATTMTYLFNNRIDLGSVENIRLVPSLTAVITDGVTVVADYDLVSAVNRFAGPIVDASVSFEVRYTDDDPAGTPTWSDWETFTVGNYYRRRAFEFRITGVVGLVDYTINVSDLSITADKADVYKRGTSTSSASADTTLTFATAFYGGIVGTDIPYVGINTVGGTGGDDVNIVSITNTGFTYSVYNAGARVARAVTWQAVGQ
jgi:hypothetical protein